MASALVATVGSASANTYATLAEAASYFADRLNSATWTSMQTTERTIALLMAARRLERENWIGARVTTTQALVWPRLDVEKQDSYSFFDSSYPGFVDGSQYYLSTEIPQPIKDAQCELALAYLEGFAEDGDAAIQEFSADGVSVVFAGSKRQTGLPAIVIRLISPFIRGTVLRRG